MPAAGQLTDLPSRAHDRFPMEWAVEFRTPRGQTAVGRTMNWSHGGMFVQTTEPLRTGERAFFRVQVTPQSLQFHLEGEIVWTRKNSKKNLPRGAGVRFLLSPTQTQKTLEGIVSLLRAASPPT